jgi:hypothetical protein
MASGYCRALGIEGRWTTTLALADSVDHLVVVTGAAAAPFRPEGAIVGLLDRDLTNASRKAESLVAEEDRRPSASSGGSLATWMTAL